MARMKYHEIASSRNLELHCFKRNKKKKSISLSLLGETLLKRNLLKKQNV